MNNKISTKPSFVFGYWRPWNEKNSFFDSYLDYLKDLSLANYTANTVGVYIENASTEQIKAINQLSQVVEGGISVFSSHLSKLTSQMEGAYKQLSFMNNQLLFLNRNVDIMIEQQRLSNMLLHNVTKLLRVPDSEKERQHSIELGIKFFVNASKDSDLYDDALEELLKAESFMKQDYFVLHRIGCIFLYVEKHLNPLKALDYFLRAAKYASVETDSNATRLVNVLTEDFNTVNTSINNSEKHIGLLASDSYEKAAFAAYVLGQFEDAVTYQLKATKLNDTPQNLFLLAKYQARAGQTINAINSLNDCIDKEPILALASFKEIDLINEPKILNLIENKNSEIDLNINILIEQWKFIKSDKAIEAINELNELVGKSYHIKVSVFKSSEENAKLTSKEILKINKEIDDYIGIIKNRVYVSFDFNDILEKISELRLARESPLETILSTYKRIKHELDNDVLQIGSKFGGGIVFYLDESGKKGLVVHEEYTGYRDYGSIVKGEYSGCRFEAFGNGIGDGTGLYNTKKIIEQSWTIKQKFWSTSKEPITYTAAHGCVSGKFGGYDDWYLPTINELKLIDKNLNNREKKQFHSIFQDDNIKHHFYCHTNGVWSSTESSVGRAWAFDFYHGEAIEELNSKSLRFFAIRAFCIEKD